MLDGERHLLRHAVATLAYRGGKVMRGAPAGFGDVRIQADTRSALEILAHMGDVLSWAVRATSGDESWQPEAPRTWTAAVDRYYATLAQLDAALAREAPLSCSAESLLQGPIADALTHIGQLATLRRVAGLPVPGEDYSIAEVVIGRVGPQQSPAKFEF
ncbi:MAG: hypothetical protein AB7O59_13165 [Pirellulales bacterium]